LPVFKDKSGGIKRRMQIIPCDAYVTKRDPDIDDKLSSDNAKSYLLNIALAGVERILANGGLSKSRTIDNVTKQYFVASDSVVAFLEEYDINEKVTKDVYRMYVAYCEEHGLNAVGSNVFGKRVHSTGKYESKQIRKDGKRPFVYLSIDNG